MENHCCLSTEESMSKCRVEMEKKRINGINLDILKENISAFNKAVQTERQTHFSKVIADNMKNPRHLFSTIC